MVELELQTFLGIGISYEKDEFSHFAGYNVIYPNKLLFEQQEQSLETPTGLRITFIYAHQENFGEPMVA